MKDSETSARYVNHSNGTQISVETFTLSDEDLIVSLSPGGRDLTIDAWVVDEDDCVILIPNAKTIRVEARGPGISDLVGRALAVTGNTLMSTN